MLENTLLSFKKEEKMSTLQERAAQRKQSATVVKVHLKSDEHHSFHFHLNDEESFELLAKLSKEAYFEKTGMLAPSFVDKTKVRKISLLEK